jgi:hypothetical protein
MFIQILKYLKELGKLFSISKLSLRNYLISYISQNKYYKNITIILKKQN